MRARTSPRGQVITTTDQIIADVDDVMVRMLGQDRADLIGRHALSFTYDRDVARNQPMPDRLAKAEPAFAITHRYVRADRSVIWIHDHVFAMPAGMGGRVLSATAETVDRPF